MHDRRGVCVTGGGCVVLCRGGMHGFMQGGVRDRGGMHDRRGVCVTGGGVCGTHAPPC